MANNYIGITDAGRQRSNNEDTFIAEPIMNGRYISACVIDGVGGYEGGEVAAELAKEVIANSIRNLQGDILSQLKQSIVDANLRIYNQKKETRENGQMACVVTLAIADLEENKFYYAHVGDTRLYLFRDHSLVKVTKDHSFVGFLEDSGRLSEEAAMRHPKRNEINKALGFDDIGSNADYIETGDSPFLPDDILLLCSDGLTDMISNSAISSILSTNKSLADRAKALVNAANDAGGKDNITTVLVWNDKPPVKHEATKPAVSQKKTETMSTEGVRLSADEHNDDLRRPVEKKRSGGTVTLLSILLLLVVAALVWLLYRDYQKERSTENIVAANPVAKDRNEREQAFVQSLDASTNGEVFVLNTEPGTPMIITDSVLIHKDSLHIIGNGVTMVADTAYRGAAFIVAPTTKYLLLDSLTLENFDVAVLMKSPGLQLKNVQFKNCKIPVQYQLSFPANAIVNGRLTDSAFYFSGNQPNNY
jgi:PPM family protein phosphatase